MRILDFNEGDKVQITRTKLRGTIICIGGKKAKVKLECSEITIEICRLRHVASIGVRKEKEIRQTIQRVRKMIRKT
jgi:hypothetical protein